MLNWKVNPFFIFTIFLFSAVLSNSAEAAGIATLSVDSGHDYYAYKQKLEPCDIFL